MNNKRPTVFSKSAQEHFPCVKKMQLILKRKNKKIGKRGTIYEIAIDRSGDPIVFDSKGNFKGIAHFW